VEEIESRDRFQLLSALPIAYGIFYTVPASQEAFWFVASNKEINIVDEATTFPPHQPQRQLFSLPTTTSLIFPYTTLPNLITYITPI
jgi:hypothetical protein